MIFNSKFGFNKPKKRFDQDNPSHEKLYPKQIKRIMRKYMKTVTPEEKKLVKKALNIQARNGLTELELRRELNKLERSGKISRPDYNKLMDVFRPYYK